MEHPALLGEGFQLGETQLLGLALMMDASICSMTYFAEVSLATDRDSTNRLMRSSVSVCFSRAAPALRRSPPCFR